MHILFYTNWYIKQTVQTANALAEHHRVTLIFPEISPELNAYEGRVAGLREILHPRITLYTLPHMQNLDPLGWIPVLKARRLIRRLRPDVIHFNESYDFRCLLLMLLCPGYPYVTSVHDPIPHSDERISLQKFKHWVRDRIRRKSDGLIVYGRTLRRKLADYAHLPLDRIYAVPHGEYRYFTHFDTKKAPATDDGIKRILFFGRWERYKGIDLLVKAEPLITERVPEARIVLAGEGRLPLSELQPEMVHPDRFIIKNYTIPDEEVPDLYRQADVVVLPYREATQSGPLHIAGSFAKPAVVSRVGAMAEVVTDGETGILVEPGDVEQLAEAVCRLLENPDEARRMGRNAYEQMKAEESMEKVAEIQAEVYRRVMEMTSRGSRRGAVMKMLQTLVKRVKRDPDYFLDESMRFGDLLAMLRKLGTAFLRGLYHRCFMGEARGLIFIGRRVKLRNRKHIHAGRNFIAEDDCEIQGLSREGIRFGDDVTVGSYAQIRPSGYYGREIGRGLTLGDRSNIGPFAYIGASGKIEIGSDVMMGPRVSLFAENHRFDDPNRTMKSQGCEARGITIEDDVWLGSGSIILDGVRVGRGSIVAAGSVVTRDVPPYTIVGGNPARVLKHRKPEAELTPGEAREIEREIERLRRSDR